MEDSSLDDRTSSIPQLLRIIIHEMLCSPALVASIYQLVARSITMVSPVMLTCLNKLSKINKRQRWGNNYDKSCFWLLVGTILADQLPLLFVVMIGHG